ncbi:origin recognition complex subunit 3 [Planococcus citri]|uniref:origin recognition complex subunit 3 n=1 Tax=Planococcus citri TaxID=170843 RepID=UPI0031F7258C
MDDNVAFSVFKPKKTTKKRSAPSNFDLIDSQPWYRDYEAICETLTGQLERIHSEQRSCAVQDVVQFVSNYQYTVERVPVISLFTGYNLPDHSSMISAVLEQLDNNEKVKCHMVNLNPAKASSVKILIESVVYDFVNAVSVKGDEFVEDEEDADNVLVSKSKCSLLRLSDWYLNNYGLLDELNKTNNDSDDDFGITYLVMVIQDIGTIPKQILNDFMKTISSVRNRLPLMFLIGVPYTLHTLEKRFTSEVYSKLAIFPFQSRPSAAFLDRVLEEIFLQEKCVFHLGSNVFEILCHSYENYNFSVKEFIKGIKLCMLEHFSQSSVHSTFCCDGESNDISDRIDNLSDESVALILDLPSIHQYNSKRKMHKQNLTVSSPTIKDELKKLYNEFNTGVIRFNAAVRCLNLLMKSLKHDKLTTPIRKIYQHVMDFDKRQQWLDSNFNYINVSTKHSLLQALKNVETMLNEYTDSELSSIRSKLSSFIERIEESQLEVIKKNPGSPIKTALSPNKSTRSPMKTRSPVKTSSPMKTRSPMKANKSPLETIRSSAKKITPRCPFVSPNTKLSPSTRSPAKNITPRCLLESPNTTKLSPSTRSPGKKFTPFRNDDVKQSPAMRRALFTNDLKKRASKDTPSSEYADTRKDLLQFLRRDFLNLYLKSLDDIPLGELFIYNDHVNIMRLLDPYPRTALNNALQDPITYLECTCCKSTPGEVLKSMPDLSILFKLHKEQGNVINLYDWFQQFRYYVDKKNYNDKDISAEIYGRFSLAMKELHFLGYISLPRKKLNGVDYVNKLAYF